jgi:hypothetical protein
MHLDPECIADPFKPEEYLPLELQQFFLRIGEPLYVFLRVRVERLERSDTIVARRQRRERAIGRGYAS